jgi:hypothetical protein
VESLDLQLVLRLVVRQYRCLSYLEIRTVVRQYQCPSYPEIRMAVRWHYQVTMTELNTQL